MKEKNELQELQNAALNWIKNQDIIFNWNDDDELLSEDIKLLFQTDDTFKLINILNDRYHERIATFESYLIDEGMEFVFGNEDHKDRDYIMDFLRSHILIDLNINCLIDNTIKRFKENIDYCWRVEKAVNDLESLGFKIHKDEDNSFFYVENTDGGLGSKHMTGQQWALISKTLSSYKLDYSIMDYDENDVHNFPHHTIFIVIFDISAK